MRYMVKTVFERREAPTDPSWNVSANSLSPAVRTTFRSIAIPIDSEVETYRHQERWIRIWLHGQSHESLWLVS